MESDGFAFSLYAISGTLDFGVAREMFSLCQWQMPHHFHIPVQCEQGCPGMLEEKEVARAPHSVGLSDGRKTAGEGSGGWPEKQQHLTMDWFYYRNLPKWLTSVTLRCSWENCNIVKGCQGGCITVSIQKCAPHGSPAQTSCCGSGFHYRVWFDLQTSCRDQDSKESGGLTMMHELIGCWGWLWCRRQKWITSWICWHWRWWGRRQPQLSAMSIRKTGSQLLLGLSVPETGMFNWK